MLKWHQIAIGLLLASTIVVAVFAFSAPRHQPANAATDAHSQQIQTSHQPDPFSWDWLTHDGAVFFTCVLALVAGVQALLFVWQLILIRDALDPAEATAKAAERSAETADKNMVVSARAWVFAGIDKASTNQGAFHFQIHAVNYGKTPAIVHRLCIKFSDHAPMLGPRHETGCQTYESVILLGPGGDGHHHEQKFGPSTSHRFAMGWINYTDIFKQERTSWFCLEVIDSAPAKVVGCPNWNDFT
jgi:hypothetical protein